MEGFFFKSWLSASCQSIDRLEHILLALPMPGQIANNMFLHITIATLSRNEWQIEAEKRISVLIGTSVWIKAEAIYDDLQSSFADLLSSFPIDQLPWCSPSVRPVQSIKSRPEVSTYIKGGPGIYTHKNATFCASFSFFL